MKDTDVTCTNCGLNFEVETWTPGKCPQCGSEYYWDEQCIFGEEGHIEDCYPLCIFEKGGKTQ